MKREPIDSTARAPRLLLALSSKPYPARLHEGGCEAGEHARTSQVFRRQGMALPERGRPCAQSCRVSQAANLQYASDVYAQPIVRRILDPQAGRPRRTEHDPHPAAACVDEKGKTLEPLPRVEHGDQVGAALVDVLTRVEPHGALVPRIVDLYQRGVEVEVKGAEELDALQYVCDVRLNTVATC